MNPTPCRSRSKGLSARVHSSHSHLRTLRVLKQITISLTLIYLLVTQTKQQTPVVLSLYSKAPGVLVKRRWALRNARGWLSLPPSTLQSYSQPCKLLTYSISTMFPDILTAERETTQPDSPLPYFTVLHFNSHVQPGNFCSILLTENSK